MVLCLATARRYKKEARSPCIEVTMHRDFLTSSIRNLAHKQDVKEDQVTTSFLYIVANSAVGQNLITERENFIIEKNSQL